MGTTSTGGEPGEGGKTGGVGQNHTELSGASPGRNGETRQVIIDNMTR